MDILDSIPPKTMDYILDRAIKAMKASSDPLIRTELANIVRDLLKAKKDTLTHRDIEVGQLADVLLKQAGIPADVTGHFLTVTDARGRTRYLYFV